MTTKPVNLENKKTLMRFIEKMGTSALKFTTPELRKDKEILEYALACSKNRFDFSCIDTKDKEVMSFIASKNGLLLKYADESLKKDSDVATIALKQNMAAINYVADEIKDNKEIMLKAVNQNPAIIRYVSERLTNDKDIAMTAIRKNPLAIKYISKELQANKLIVLMAVEKNGILLEYASDELKNNFDVVYSAVRQKGSAIEYASEKYKNDKTMVKLAIKRNPSAIKYVSKEMQADKEIILMAVEKRGVLIEYASDELKKDQEVIMTAITENPRAINYVAEEQKIFAIKNALKIHKYKVFKELPEEYKDNKTILLYCIYIGLNDAKVIDYFNVQNFQNDIDFKAAIKNKTKKIQKKYKSKIENIEATNEDNSVENLTINSPEDHLKETGEDFDGKAIKKTKEQIVDEIVENWDNYPLSEKATGYQYIKR